MSDLPNWVATALDVFFYVVVVPGLIAYAVFGVALLLSPIVFAFWGNARPIDRILAGLGFCLLVVAVALNVL